MPRLTSEICEFFVGLDLGQSRDHSALAVVERADVFTGIDPVTYERRRRRRYRLRFLERVRLGTPYPAVVDRVAEVVRRPALSGRCMLVMDATGVGAPVLDLLRAAGLGCAVTPVILTAGDGAFLGGRVWRVPKRDLISGLQLMLEKEELGLPARLAAARVLARELAAVEERVGSAPRTLLRYGAWREEAHDDLVIAAALACWRARWKSPPVWGAGSLGLGYT
ncbi:MAG TPA: hypothetical protein VL285_12350 [Bryobacteraceae bacterium]|jgi:hypothetical protein|nr:hypothetical protein [Bryobacteraceae bacterium]